jgi:hypothetical protein
MLYDLVLLGFAKDDIDCLKIVVDSWHKGGKVEFSSDNIYTKITKMAFFSKDLGGKQGMSRLHMVLAYKAINSIFISIGCVTVKLSNLSHEPVKRLGVGTI